MQIVYSLEQKMEDIWNGLFRSIMSKGVSKRLYTMARQLGVITIDADIKILADKLYADSINKNPQGLGTYNRIMLGCMDNPKMKTKVLIKPNRHIKNIILCKIL